MRQFKIRKAIKGPCRVISWENSRVILGNDSIFTAPKKTIGSGSYKIKAKLQLQALFLISTHPQWIEGARTYSFGWAALARYCRCFAACFVFSLKFICTIKHKAIKIAIYFCLCALFDNIVYYMNCSLIHSARVPTI